MSYRELSVDICETNDGLWLWADLPGVDENSVDVQVDRNVLTIEGRVPESQATQAAAYGEYDVGGFQRKFRLSNEIDTDRIEARMRDGVLELRLPKAEHAKRRRIEVNLGA
jgi:HSP20 family molecular chaperone IbpA